jgi:hypothetical protein
MAWRLFYSYSHKDADLRGLLGTHLAPLKRRQKISEWHDRKIEPGANWHTEISSQLETADLILFLLSADFMESEYCFGVEVEKAMERAKRDEVKIAPILLRPCLWQESPFSELQIIPRDARAITAWPSLDGAFEDVASEIRKIVSESPPSRSTASTAAVEPRRFDSSLDLVREQVRSYARLYERTRQRMRASDARTRRMEQIFQKMRNLATASYPLLDELAASYSPGERLAAVAILQVFAAEQSLPFLVKLISSEKPFVGYHAAKALQFAVGALDAHTYPQLLEAIQKAQQALISAAVGFDSDRAKVLHEAEAELQSSLNALSIPARKV